MDSIFRNIILELYHNETIFFFFSFWEIINLCSSLFLFSLSFFVSSYAQFWLRPDAHVLFNRKKILGPHELFDDSFGDALGYKKKKITDDFRTAPLSDSEKTCVLPNYVGLPNEPKGRRELVAVNSGGSAMHAIL